MIIPAVFDPQFRAQIAQQIKHYGIHRVHKMMIDANYHPAFIGGLIRSIIRKEGW